MEGGFWDALASELTEIILTIRHKARVQAAQIIARIARGMRVRAILTRS
jgi:hypothetical protein